MTSEFWWQVIVTVLSVGVGVVTIKVDVSWLKKQFGHHEKNDEQRFGYVQARLDKMADFNWGTDDRRKT